MATNKIIGATISVDSDQAQKSVKNLKDDVKALNKEFENATAGSEEQAAAYKKLKAAQDELAKSTEAANQQYQATNQNFKNIKEGLSNTSGPLKTASEGVTSLGEAFKALLANPVVLVITAIVAALAFLYKAFTNTAEGGEKAEQVFAGIKAAASAVLDSILKLGGAIIKLFSGDFKGALTDASDAITGVVSAATNAYTAVSKLTAQAQALRKEQAANDIDQAKRAAELAKLREQATDPEVDVKKRKEALLELQKAAQEDAVKDLDLAKRVAENKIALLSIGTDAAKKNYAEIDKIRVEQIQAETDSANELRRIGKQITAANKEELAQRKADVAAAAEEAKKRREQLLAFNSQLRKIQNENQIAETRNQYDKELQALENKIKDEQDAIKKQFEDGKLTRAQYNQLVLAEQENTQNQRDQLRDKHMADVRKKEEDFQKELNKIITETRLDGITDEREAEKVKLQIQHEEKIAAAIIQYKDDANKLFQIKQALDAQFRAEQDKIDEKNRAADEKKRIADQFKSLGGIAGDPNQAFKARRAAVDKEVALNQELYDKKKLTEAEYTDNARRFADARIQIDKQEMAAKLATADKIGGLFDSLSEAVGKQTAAGKAFAAASATIATIESAVKSFNALADIPVVGPALGAVAAAAALVSGYSNVKKILAVDVPGQGSGSSASGSGATAPSIPSAPVAPRQASTSLDQSSINKIGQAQTGIKAYVLEQDNSAALNRQARLAGASKLGG